MVNPATPPPTQPQTAPPPRPGPVGDPFNCAVDPENTWNNDKKTWCCRVHHRGCPPTAPPPVIIAPPPVAPPPPPVVMPAPVPARPADPYNCADGFANWQAGWSIPKKEWCCRAHGKGCPNQGGGCATSSKPYDCNAGFANWMAGSSVAKKAWCCSNEGKGLPTSSWWVCLEVALKCPGSVSAARSSHMCSLKVAALAFVPSSGAQRQLSEGSDRRGGVVKALAFVPSSGARPLSDKCDDSGLRR